MVAGIWQARRDGHGCDVDLSLFETALALLTYIGTWTASRGWAAQRLADSSHQTVVPFQTFRAADGWLAVACAKESLWRRLCDALQRSELAGDPRFADLAARNANREALVAILAEAFEQRPVAEWVALLARHGVPSASVNDIDGALADSQTQARAAVVGYEHPTLGAVRTVASALGETLTAEAARGPLLGEHTRELLAEVAGFSHDEIDELERAGAFGER